VTGDARLLGRDAGRALRVPGSVRLGVRQLVERANRRGGEDNITAVAFRVVPDSAAEETMQLPALREPDEDTVEDVEAPGGDTLVIPPDRIEPELLDASPAVAGEPLDTTRRIRLALTAVVLLAAAAVLLTWGLLR